MGFAAEATAPAPRSSEPERDECLRDGAHDAASTQEVEEEMLASVVLKCVEGKYGVDP